VLAGACLTGALSACGDDPAPTSGRPAAPAEAVGGSVVLQYIQEALSLTGFFGGQVDGVLGEDSRDAIRRFQTAKGLRVSGTVDAATVTALQAASPEAGRLLIAALQTELTDLGFYEGPIDGNPAAPGMTDAVKALQQAAGITVDGIVGEETFAVLQRRYLESLELTAATSTSAASTSAAPGTTVAPTGGGAAATTSSTAALQRRLAELGYRPGTADGRFGVQTASAVLAFQKREGLPRTSRVDDAVLARLDRPTGAGPRSTAAGPRVEIDLDRQVLFFIGADKKVTTINTSTGSGETYEEDDGTESVAYTPTGTFSVFRRVDGPDEAPLGTLYRPLYFVRGWAIHGSPVVPAYPASHGCARTANWDQDFLFPLLANGAQVRIYGTSLGAPEGADAGF
jgi:peptidoglycan hydrolase-like protein with peptidoglycan-binding domain